MIFFHSEQETLAKRLGETGQIETRRFPDGETYLRILSNVRGKDVRVLASLNRPDEKAMWLYFLAKTLREQGAPSVHLIAPYLGYMRQDKAFQNGESITSRHFAKFLSSIFDSLVTIDPHLHRIASLSEIYSIPTQVLHATQIVAEWIRKNVSDPVIVGPDAESEQWVNQIGGADHLVLEKHRLGDREVSVKLPDVARFSGRTPVLIDDIISTAQTMIQTVNQLRNTSMAAPICIGIHAVFSGPAYENLKAAGAGQIITTNTIPHPSNAIDVSGLLLPSPSTRGVKG